RTRPFRARSLDGRCAANVVERDQRRAAQARSPGEAHNAVIRPCRADTNGHGREGLTSLHPRLPQLDSLAAKPKAFELGTGERSLELHRANARGAPLAPGTGAPTNLRRAKRRTCALGHEKRAFRRKHRPVPLGPKPAPSSREPSSMESLR